MKRSLSIGLFTADDLHRAFQVALARADLRRLRARAARREFNPVLGSDCRSNGKLVPL